MAYGSFFDLLKGIFYVMAEKGPFKLFEADTFLCTVRLDQPVCNGFQGLLRETRDWIKVCHSCFTFVSIEEQVEAGIVLFFHDELLLKN